MARPTDAEIAAKDQVTTAIGLFNFADSYLLCGKTLTSQPMPGLRFADPVSYLFFHAIELYLKAYLRQQGMTAYELARPPYSHNLVSLRDKAATFGLMLEARENERIDHLQAHESVIEARYIRTGHKQVISLEALLGSSERIRERVQITLTQAGVQLRPGPFYPGITFDTSHRSFPQLSEDIP